MQLYCKPITPAPGADGIVPEDVVLLVVGVHADDQAVPAAAYGEGVTILPYLGPLGPLDLLNKPPPALDLAKYATARRKAVEASGVTVGDQRIATDRVSQALITGAFNLSMVVPSTTFSFKAEAGFVVLDSAAIHIVAVSVGQHVQACFTKEAEVLAGIAAGTITSLAAVDAAFAPLAQ